MRTNCCALQGLEEHIESLRTLRQSRVCSFPILQALQLAKKTRTAVIVDFRDEAYASIDGLLKNCGLTTYRAENASELANKLARKRPDLVLLNGLQPDESAWLTCAKLRTVDASRPVWIYSPEPPSALDGWLSMVHIDDVIVYGGVIHRLLELLQDRLLPEIVPVDRNSGDGQRRTVA